MSSYGEMVTSCGEEEFDKVLQDVDIKGLIQIISALQLAMKKEQADFSMLQTKLEGIPTQSGPEFTSLSQDLVKSQDRIGMLMQRNMKCFNAQKNVKYSAKSETEKASKPVIDKSANNSQGQKSGANSIVIVNANAKREAPPLPVAKQEIPSTIQAPSNTQVPVNARAPSSVQAPSNSEILHEAQDPIPNNTQNGSKQPKGILKKSLPSVVDATSSSNSSTTTDPPSLAQKLKGSQVLDSRVTAMPNPALHRNSLKIALEYENATFADSEHVENLNSQGSAVSSISRDSPPIPVTNIDDITDDEDDNIPPLPASPPPLRSTTSTHCAPSPEAHLKPGTNSAFRVQFLDESTESSTKPNILNGETEASTSNQIESGDTDVKQRDSGIETDLQALEKKPSSLKMSLKPDSAPAQEQFDISPNPEIGNSKDRDSGMITSPGFEVPSHKNKMVSVVPRKKSPAEMPQGFDAVKRTDTLGNNFAKNSPTASPDVSHDPVQMRKMTFEKSGPPNSIENTMSNSSVSKGKIVSVRPKSVPGSGTTEPATGKIGTSAIQPRSGAGPNVLQGKMVSVVPRKKEAPKPVPIPPAACSASVVENGACVNNDAFSKTRQGGRIITIGRVSGAHPVEVLPEDMLKPATELDYAIDSVTISAKFQTGKMASFKKDRNDNNSLKGSVDIPDDDEKTVALPMAESLPHDDEDELVKERTTLLHWDPVKLLEDLYDIKQVEDHADDLSKNYIQMAGYLDKLPMNKKKATMLKTWKRRYFRAKDGNLFYYDGNHSDKPAGFIQLMGGSVEEAENRMIGIDDGRGHYVLLRCPTDREHQDWMVALQSQVMGSPQSLYVKPVLNPKPHFRKKIVIIDIGGSSVRGGVLGMDPSLPQVFFPTVVAINKTTGEMVFGGDAFKPEVRSQSKLIYPLRKSAHVDKVNLEKEILPGLLKKVFIELKRHPTMYHLLLCTPFTLSAKTLSNLMDSMLEEYQVKAISMVYQPIMALYSYSVTSGIVVDIGERCDVVPVIDGFLMSAGISRQPYGAYAISESLNQNLTENKFRFHTDVEKLLVRLAQENACYVSQDFAAENERFIVDREPFVHTVDISKYDLPEDTFTELTCDSGRFRAPEGMFDTELYGQDTPFLHKVIHKAIQDCPMDSRREMCRSIYLSGGTTLLPGFTERLKTLLETLVPKSCVVEVHASPHRYHAAYIGCCIQANLDGFEQGCIGLKEWKNNPQDCMRRLQAF